MAEFTLYIGNKCFSSWSLRPWVAMKHLEIPFEEVFVRLRTPQSAENLAKVSPTGLVPVLDHRGRIVWETLAILEYLADLFRTVACGQPNSAPGRWPDRLRPKCTPASVKCATAGR